MELIIRDSSKLIDSTFGKWLIPQIKIKLLSKISNYNFKNIDKYLTESDEIKRLYKKDYTSKDVIIFAADNLVCNGTDGEIYISFSNTKYVPGYDRFNLLTAVKTINYGTLSVKGCPIFTDTFKYFEKNIQQFVELFYRI